MRWGIPQLVKGGATPWWTASKGLQHRAVSNVPMETCRRRMRTQAPGTVPGLQSGRKSYWRQHNINLSVWSHVCSSSNQTSFNQPWLYWRLQVSWGAPPCPSPAPQCDLSAGRDRETVIHLSVMISSSECWGSRVSPFAVWMALWSQESASGPDPVMRWEEHQTDHFLRTKTPTFTEAGKKCINTLHKYHMCIPLLLILTALWGLRSIPAVSNRAVDSTRTNLCTWKNVAGE